MPEAINAMKETLTSIQGQLKEWGIDRSLMVPEVYFDLFIQTINCVKEALRTCCSYQLFLSSPQHEVLRVSSCAVSSVCR